MLISDVSADKEANALMKQGKGSEGQESRTHRNSGTLVQSWSKLGGTMLCKQKGPDVKSQVGSHGLPFLYTKFCYGNGELKWVKILAWKHLGGETLHRLNDGVFSSSMNMNSP